MNKTLLTLQQRFFCPRMADYVRSYIIGCHVCQLVQTWEKIHKTLSAKEI